MMAFFFTCALTCFFEHRTKFPYGSYELVCISYILIFVLYIPALEPLWKSTAGRIIHDLINIAGIPTPMLALTRLSHTLPRMKVKAVLFIAAPFALYPLCHHLIGLRWLDTACFGLLIMTVILWCIWVIQMSKAYNKAIRNYLSNIEEVDIEWINIWVIVLTTMVIFWCIRNWASPDTNITPIIDYLLYLPAFMLFAFFYRRHKYLDIWSLMAEQTNVEIPFTRNQALKIVISSRRDHLNRQGTDSNNADHEAYNPAAITSPTNLHRAATNERIRQGLARLEDRDPFYKQSDLSVHDLAKKLETNRTYLANFFKDNGTSFYEYIENLRITEAERLLKEDSLISLNAVLVKCGFGSRATFNRAFERRFGMKPSEYRKNITTTRNTDSQNQ